MNKLLNKYRAVPTAANRAKLQAYLNKHFMAVCLASPDDQNFLTLNNFSF